MTWRVLTAVLLLWLVAGLYGLNSYAHDYAVYRGFEPPKDPVGVTVGRRMVVHFYSPALKRASRYLIYLPPRYSALAAHGRRFPVLYMLHGAPGKPELFFNAGHLGVDLDVLLDRHRIAPMLIVAPYGQTSFHEDNEWANTPLHGPYESYVLDTVRAVDAHWPTIRDRGHRVLAGNSEGGYAAGNITLRHLHLFENFESWSGYFEQTGHGAFRKASPARVAANSPVGYVTAMRGPLRRHPVHAFIYTGRKDKSRKQVAQFAGRLRAAGGHVIYAKYRGRHEWRLWREQTPRSLMWASARFKAAGVR
jgi:enterochelin esterase-like enzyme